MAAGSRIATRDHRADARALRRAAGDQMKLTAAMEAWDASRTQQDPRCNLRIQYETREADMARVNLALVTEDYRGRIRLIWDEGRIRVSKRWEKGADGETKTATSDGYVPLYSVLAQHLRAWQRQTPQAKSTDF